VNSVEKTRVIVADEVSFGRAKIVTVSKPPWTSKFHKGKLERIILLIGRGKGKFSEVEGIPRSIGCLGNNRLTLYREKLPISKFKEVIDEFSMLNPNGEVYITNYDDIKDAVELAEYSAKKGLDTYLIALSVDVPNVPKDRKFKLVGEYFYQELDDSIDDVDILLIVANYTQYRKLLDDGLRFSGEVWVDLLYPGSLKFLDFNPIEVRKILNPSSITYSPCMSGLVAISPEGFATPCPLLRKFIVGDVTKESLKTIVKKQRLRKFWKLTKDKIETCKRCSFRYMCHDCRALEYQATGELFGVEFCPLLDAL